jgi:hypothetical protein
MVDHESFLSADYRAAIERALHDPQRRREVIAGLVDVLHSCEEMIAFNEAFGSQTESERWQARKVEVVTALRRLRGIP